MTISAEKLEVAILAILRHHKGKLEVSMNGQYGWLDLVREHLGEILDPLKIESALKRLRSDGIVCLTQYNPDLGVRFEYRAGESDDRVFFRRWNFEVAITEEGRGYLGGGTRSN
jgi:DNA-binding transcriptional ArsR family regulator